jgi:hypothetical protein
MKFHGWTSIPLGWLQIHTTHKNGFKKKTVKFELKRQKNSICSKKNLGRRLNFDSAPLILQREFKQNFKK